MLGGAERKVRGVRRRVRRRYGRCGSGRCSGHRSLIRLCNRESVVRCRRPTRVGAKGSKGGFHGAGAGRSRTLNRSRSVSVRCGIPMICLPGRSIDPLLIKVVILCPLVTPTSHTDITTNPNTTTLLCDNPTQRSAGGQTGELLGTVDGEGNGFDFEAEVDVRLGRARLGRKGLLHGVLQRGVSVGILGVLDLLIQMKAQPITTLVAH